MTEQAVHCPFLNRADPRCSNHFSLDSLDHAFAYCFGQYQQCPVYGELLSERRRWRGDALSRAEDADALRPVIQVTLHGRAAESQAYRYRQRAA